SATGLGAGDPLAHQRDRRVVPAPPGLRARRERRSDTEGYDFVETVQRDARGLGEARRIPVDASRKADRSPEVSEPPSADGLGALEVQPRLDAVLASEDGRARKESLIGPEERL